MPEKLARNVYPSGHTENDFECFGPVAIRDADFTDRRMADLGCFKQDEGVDSNKFYHISVVRSKINGKWYAYFQWGRTDPSGRPNKPAFQFFECLSEDDAYIICLKQFNEKNTKRGQWETISGLQIYTPKVKKSGTEDLYVVRPLATRLVGLPAAQNIANSDAKGALAVPVKADAPKKGVKLVKSKPVDEKTQKLFRDLIGGAVTFSKTFLSGSTSGSVTLPTSQALSNGREILDAAMARVKEVGDEIDDQVSDRTLQMLTRNLHGLIPKDIRGAQPEKYMLSKENINGWRMDIDVLETALKAEVVTTHVHEDAPSLDAMHGIPATMSWYDPNSEGKWLADWWKNATRHGHGHRPLNIHNMWSIERHGDRQTMRLAQKDTFAQFPTVWNNERPLHQMKQREDLSPDDRKLFWNTNTALMFHGTRSVNVPGIIRESLRFPSQLTGVKINGAMFGPGNYFADDWGKSGGYCSKDSGSSRYVNDGHVAGRHSFMFLFDVICGVPHVASEDFGYTEPPHGCHCVFGKARHTKSSWGGSLANNEWIIYRRGRIEMRYIAEVSF